MYCHAVTLLLLFSFVARGRTNVNHETLSVCGEDAVLRCLVSLQSGVQYRSLRWYRVSDSPAHQLTGLVMKRLTPNNSTVEQYKSLQRKVQFLDDSQSLILFNVTLQDTGRYRCFFSAPLGHQNQESEVYLRVYERPKDDSRKPEGNDTLYVALAITLLTVAFLMLYASYICLKNTLKKHNGKFSKAQLTMTHQMKHLVVNLESKGLVTKALPQEYVGHYILHVTD